MEVIISLLLGIIGAALLVILSANAFLLKSILEGINNIDKANGILSEKHFQLNTRLETIEDLHRDITKRVYYLEQEK